MNRRNPFDEIERFFDRMSEQFEDMDDWTGLEGALPGRLKVDVADYDDSFEVTADLPGYTEDDIEVELADDRLRIAAEHESEAESEEPGRYVRQERSKDTVSRTVTLPEPVEETEVEASFKNGVLTVTLPKASDAEEAHHIDIE